MKLVSYIELRFINSFTFLPISLEKLVNTLEREQFKVLGKYFPINQLDLVTRKLAYQYEYMYSLEKYNEKYLPPIDKFYSSLNGKHFKKMLDKYDMKIYHSQNEEKSAIECFNKTLNEYNFKKCYQIIEIIPLEVNKFNENSKPKIHLVFRIELELKELS